MAGWRIVIVSKRAKLDFKLNYLEMREETTSKVFLDEIAVLMIESTAVSLTAYLMSELIKRNIKVIFCDNKRNPIGEIVGYYGSHDTSLKVRNQVLWDQNLKEKIWTEIVFSKILSQRNLLAACNCDEYKLLDEYMENLEHYDKSNREGHAAKVYFNALFGSNFSRKQDNVINCWLNYGYSILLSLFNREIVASGYITQLAFFHDNMFNKFNFGCDLMEPFRPLVDLIVVKANPQKFDKDSKYEILEIINSYVKIDKKRYTLKPAINIYCQSIFKCLNENGIDYYHHPEMLYEL